MAVVSCTAFPSGKERLKERAEWQTTAVAMATDQGPYRALFKKMHAELAAFTGGEGASCLASPGQYLRRDTGGRQIVPRRRMTGLMSKALERGGRIFSAIGKGADKVSDENRLASVKIGVQAHRDYQSALDEISAKAASRK